MAFNLQNKPMTILKWGGLGRGRLNHLPKIAETANARPEFQASSVAASLRFRGGTELSLQRLQEGLVPEAPPAGAGFPSPPRRWEEVSKCSGASN